MDSSYDDSSSDERGSSMNSHDKKIYHRHTNQQIERLEAYYKENPHPDDSHRRQLGEELNLRPKQIKFWFQNKRTQSKTQCEKADNAALRAANLKIRAENEAFEAALKRVVCPPCGGPSFIKEEREHCWRLQNAFLKEQKERMSSYLKQHGVTSIPSVDALPNASTSNDRRSSYGTSYNHLHEPPSSSRRPYARENINITPPPQPQKPFQLQGLQQLSQMEKMLLINAAAKTVEEVMKLIHIEEPMWLPSSVDGRLVINPGNYEKCFPKVSPFKSSVGVRPESSKEVVVVQMDAGNLVDMFLDAEKWARLFPTIVNEAKTIHLLEPDEPGRHNYSRVMYEQLHILSPLVPPREFMILRTCQQMEEGLWMIADVSCDLPNVQLELPPNCYKRPSGVLIQALPNGHSQVTWIEHVEVFDKLRPSHRLYKDLVSGSFGYGARRWTVTLERMCERLSLSSVSDFPTTDYAGVVKTIEGRRRIMDLGERMLKNFALILKMSEKLDFSQLSETNNSGVRVSVRVNREAGQPGGLIVCAGSSLSLPVPPLQVYNFLTNLEIRHQWDVLCHGSPVTELARFATGADPKNCVTFLQPSGEGDNSQMMILQDSFIDALGGMVVYAPLDLNTAYTAVSGTTISTGIPILPSGFIISRDNRRSSAATEPHDGRNSGTTLLTVAFQILVVGPIYTKEIKLEESTATVNNLISSSVQRIKAMLNCDSCE